MEPTHSHHYGPARDAFAEDDARKRQRAASSGSSEVEALSNARSVTHSQFSAELPDETLDGFNSHEGVEASTDSKVDAFAALILVFCVAGAMLLWVSTR